MMRRTPARKSRLDALLFAGTSTALPGPNKAAALTLLLFSSLLLTACGTPEPAQRDRFYRLTPPAPTQPTASTPLGATLLVNDLAARGFLGGRQVVYRTREQPLEVHRYNLLLWEEPPGHAIAGQLAAAVRAVDLFALVITPAQRNRADYVLGGEVDRFEHLPTAQPPRVVADFNLTLSQGADRRPLFSHRYQGQEATRGNSPEAMALAFNQLSGRLVAEAVRDLQAERVRLRAAPGR